MKIMESPKRSVGKRRAAADSERKWKEAIDEEKVFDIQQEETESSENQSMKPKPAISISKALFAHIENTTTDDQSPIDDKECIMESDSADNCAYTVLDDIFLKDLFTNFACSGCNSKNLNINIKKDSLNETQNLFVSCCDCQMELVNKDINQYQSFLRLCKHKCWCSPGKHSSYYTAGEKRNCDFNGELLMESYLFDTSSDGSNSDDEGKVNAKVSNVNNAESADLLMDDEQGPLSIIAPDIQTSEESSPKKKTRVRPIRPCVFCSKMEMRLSRHVKMEHNDHPFVQRLLSQPPNIQAKMMRQLRYEGIFAENQRRINSGSTDLLKVRNQGSGELSVCIACKGYFKKKLMWRHRLSCLGSPRIDQRSARRKGSGVKGRRKRGRPSKAEMALRDNEASEVLVTEVSPHNFCWDNYPANEETDPNSEALEINAIEQIVESLQPNILTQNVCIKTEKLDDEVYQNGFVSPEMLRGLNGQVSENKDGNEDQLLFDSLPAILSNSNGSCENSRVPQAPPKKRSRESWSDHDENNYYLMSDFQSVDMHDFNLFNSLGQPMRKRKSRSEFQYKFWTKEEEERILNYFTELIKYDKIPGKDACEEFLKLNTDIQTDWSRVKYKVYNEIQKRKKTARRLAQNGSSEIPIS